MSKWVICVKKRVLPILLWVFLSAAILLPARAEELLLLEKHNLTYLMLEELNSRIPQVHGPQGGAACSLYCNYHIGGVFNSFRYWLSENMATSPEKLAMQCVTFLPKDFTPMLLERRE